MKLTQPRKLSSAFSLKVADASSLGATKPMSGQDMSQADSEDAQHARGEVVLPVRVRSLKLSEKTFVLALDVASLTRN